MIWRMRLGRKPATCLTVSVSAIKMSTSCVRKGTLILNVAVAQDWLYCQYRNLMEKKPSPYRYPILFIQSTSATTPVMFVILVVEYMFLTSSNPLKTGGYGSGRPCIKLTQTKYISTTGTKAKDRMICPDGSEFPREYFSSIWAMSSTVEQYPSKQVAFTAKLANFWASHLGVQAKG